MSDDTLKRLISILSTAAAFMLATRLAEDYLDQPERRGVEDDVKEALIQASASLLATVAASVLIRRVIAGR